MKEILKTDAQVKEDYRHRFKMWQRFHYWLCDLFNLCSFDDLLFLRGDLNSVFVKIDGKLGEHNRFWKSQDEFNRLVAERLHLKMKNEEKLKEVEENDKGVYQ
jgi:hypothetical protein